MAVDVALIGYARALAQVARRAGLDRRASTVHYSRRLDRVNELFNGAFRGVPRTAEMDDGAWLAASVRSSTDTVVKTLQARAADAVCIDLEDASSERPDLKPVARDVLVAGFRQVKPEPSRLRGFRPNNIRTEFFVDDMEVVLREVGAQIGWICLPDNTTAEDIIAGVEVLRTLRRAYGLEHPIWVEAMIETPRAFEERDRILQIPEVAAIEFGLYDMSRTVGARQPDPATWTLDWMAVRNLMAVSAAAHNKDAGDAVTAKFPVRPKTKPGSIDDGKQRALQQAALLATLDPVGIARILAGKDPEKAEAEAIVRDGDDGIARFVGFEPTDGDRRYLQELRNYIGLIGLAYADALNAYRVGMSFKWAIHPDQLQAINAGFLLSRPTALAVLARVTRFAQATFGGAAGAIADPEMGLVDRATAAVDANAVRDALGAGIISTDDVSTAFKGTVFEGRDYPALMEAIHKA